MRGYKFRLQGGVLKSWYYQAGIIGYVSQAGFEILPAKGLRKSYIIKLMLRSETSVIISQQFKL